MSYGKVLVLTYTSIINSIISLIVMFIATPAYGVGGAVIAYLVYNINQLLVVYIYYLPVVLKQNPTKVFFVSFFKPVINGGIIAAFVMIVNSYYGCAPSLWNSIFLSVVFFTIYGALILRFVVKKDEIKNIYRRLCA